MCVPPTRVSSGVTGPWQRAAAVPAAGGPAKTGAERGAIHLYFVDHRKVEQLVTRARPWLAVLRLRAKTPARLHPGIREGVAEGAMEAFQLLALRGPRLAELPLLL